MGVVTEGGDEATCVARGTCFAGLATGRHEQLPNYANFRFFSETLLAGVLSKEYEVGIMTWRESHNGTVAGMTRFREKLDDYPILGYGRGDLSHDRLKSFHLLLAGHSANYMSRGTFWGTEQRTQNQIIEDRWRNTDPSGESGSLCMVSSIAPAIWLRWALVDDSPWTRDLFIARGAPRRWYQRYEPFGIGGAPTRFGRVSYSIERTGDAQLVGTVGLRKSASMTALRQADLRFAVHVCSPKAGSGTPSIIVEHGVLEAWHAENETAIFRSNELSFNFTVTFAGSVSFI